MKKTMLTYVAFAILLAGCSSDEDEIKLSIPQETSAVNTEKISAAAGLLIEKCPGIKKYWSDLKQVAITVTNANGYSEQRDLGWNEFVEFELLVASPPRDIPAKYYSTGHHCYYRVGTSINPGVDVSKKPCQSICKDSVPQP